MGVPKFFRWLSERYPCLCEEIKEYQVPEFDNLYLDMNGIIHVCSHPNDFDPHFRISEEQIFTSIFHYVEVLFRLIRPKKLFFMAVDGVAPRAKMNQQRGRRFSSAKEAENLEKKALEKGESLPTQKRFDSNCITPGTKFMAKLQEQLKYFVANKISNDKLWRQPTIILSGHSVPGEGEHKIMDYIRHLRSQPDWDPLTRHCLYGLDADLIILGLCTHEPNFSLLREEVKFVKSAKSKTMSTPETTNYNLIHLSLLRGYLDLEFQALKNGLPFPYDIEKIIDDWVLMGFLVGNDFIPHLPHLHIHTNALGILYNTYRAVLPELDGYINENGLLNLERFEKFLIELSQFDMDNFNDTYTDMKYLESKTGRKVFAEDEAQQGEVEGKSKTDDGLNELIEATEREMFDFGDDSNSLDEPLEPDGFETIACESEEDKLIFREFNNHKRHYYMNKMEYPSVTKEVLVKEAEGYVTALQWILFYYYRGCPSWSWYYHHHYSPYVSDLRGFSSLNVSFKLGKPFLPFQQLLAVLPAASREFLPEGYQSLMTSEDSPIIDYYPSDIKFDLNGKRQEWEAVVLIPFIKENRLLDAMEPFNEQLTEEETFRNSHGPMQVYNYTSESLGKYSSPSYFPDITSNHAKCVDVYPSEVAVLPQNLVTGRHHLLANSEHIYMPGFPVLSTLNITGTLEKRGVKIFEHPSRGENMILRIKHRPELNKTLEQLANDLISRDFIYVSYPHLTPARVSMLISQSSTAQRQKAGQERVIIQDNSNSAQDLWSKKINSIKETHLNKFGIDISSCNMLIYAHPLEGTKLNFSSGIGYNDMIWSSEAVGYPVDTCLTQVVQRLKEKNDFERRIPLEEIFPPSTFAFMLGRVDYGSTVEVKEVTNNHLILIKLIKTSEPDLFEVKKEIDSMSTQYYPGYICAQRLGISNHLFSRLTSSIFVQSPHTDSDKTNIGLALKFTRTNQLVVGYTRTAANNAWLYSDKSIELVRQYMDQFPELFEYLSLNTKEDIYFKDKMFPNDTSGTKLNEIRAWLKTLDKGERRSTESELLEPAAIKRLEKALGEYTENKLELKTIILKPHHLYLPKPDLMVAAPDPEADHKILDRIVYIRECHSIPLGAKGIIIGAEKKTSKSLACENTVWEEAATLYDVLFDNEIIGGQAILGCTKKQVYRLTKQVFINISYGQRKLSSSAYQNKQTNRQSVSLNTCGSKAGFNPRTMNAMMPSFSHPNSGNQNANRGQRNQANAALNPDDPSTDKPSGSVTKFFNSYLNNVNSNEVNPQILRAKNTETSDNDSNKDATGGTNQNVILSQTFTRSSSGQQKQPPQSRDNRPQSGNSARPNSQQFQNNINTNSRAVAPPPQAAIPNQFVEQTEALKKILCIKSPGNSNNSENNNIENNRRGGQRSTDQIRPLMDMETESNKTKRWSAPAHGSGSLYGTGTVSHTASRPCGHLPSCTTYFFNLCSLYRMDEPVTWLNNSDDGIIAYCKLQDGYLFCGPFKNTPAQAKEAMACKGISVLSERYGPPTDPNTIHNSRRHLGIYQAAAPSQVLFNPVQAINVSAARGSGFIPPYVARTARGESNTGPSNTSDNSRRPALLLNPPRFSALQPHAQTSDSSSQQQSAEEVREESSKKRNKRKVRLAANFNNPINQN